LKTNEYRAVFEYPPSGISEKRIEYGPWREKVEDAAKDKPWRPDESHGQVVGLQKREVGPPKNL
jgi:hypothetical protein